MTVHQCWYSRNEKLRPAFNKNNYCVSDIACGHSYRIISVILRTHHEFVDKNSRTSCTVELSLFMYLMVGSAREWPRFLRSEATITAVSYANASFFLLPSLCCVFFTPATNFSIPYYFGHDFKCGTPYVHIQQSNNHRNTRAKHHHCFLAAAATAVAARRNNLIICSRSRWIDLVFNSLLRSIAQGESTTVQTNSGSSMQQ